MSILTQCLPQTVMINNLEYAINADFRIGIQFESLLAKQMSESDRIVEMLKLYYPIVPSDLTQAIQRIIWFYQCGKEPVQSKESGKASYSFDQDDSYIFSAFLDQYGIDLSETTHLHWWKFRGMFQSLREDHQIMKIMGYRSIKITGSMSAEQRRFYKDMKKIYALNTESISPKMTVEEYHQSMIDYVHKRSLETRKKG